MNNLSAKCQSCNATVSSSAPKCYNCGEELGKKNDRQFQGKSIAGVISFLVGLSIAGIMGAFSIFCNSISTAPGSYKPRPALVNPVPAASVPAPGFPVSVRGRRMGNIAPYRREMISRIASSWNTTRFDSVAQMSFRIEVAKDGHVERVRIVDSSGQPELDRLMVKTIQEVEFAPLPDWYRGESLTFQISLRDIRKKLKSSRGGMGI